jgi:hypothetical protein
MSDYVKQLEERNEQLEKQLGAALSSLNALSFYNRKLVFYMYSLEVRKAKGEWFMWQYSEEKHDLFTPFGKFASTLFEFDEITLRSTRTCRLPLNDVQYVWHREQAWKIDLMKEKNKRGNDVWIISDYENFAQYKMKEDWKDLRGTTFISYLRRRHKIRMKQL